MTVPESSGIVSERSIAILRREWTGGRKRVKTVDEREEVVSLQVKKVFEIQCCVRNNFALVALINFKPV